MSERTNGVLQMRRNEGFLRDPASSFRPSTDDAWVSPKLIREYGLVEGALVSGSVRRGREGNQLISVESICGLTSAQFQARTRFDRLVVVDPMERFRIGDEGNVAMRVIELIAPIGKGSRAIIAAPPQAGKTQLLEQIANAIHASDPAVRVILLLIDERPEEVTHFRRHVQAEVLASSNDEAIATHVELAELTLAHVRCDLECGRDVVLLVDSLTRMSRAFNLRGSGAGRTMSGGLDAKALELPRKFFGLARNIEKGGSVTVIATVLIETGSRMDDHIFEEFKSTGNSELVLDRSLAELRIFPAINVLASGTRKEELLYTPEEMEKVTLLRRWLAGRDPKVAMRGLLDLMAKAPTNAELLQRLKPKR